MRREFILWLAMTLVAGAQACSASPELTQSRTQTTFVWISPTTDGYAISVNDETVRLDQLDSAVLRHAMNANPDLTAEQVRADVRIYISVRGAVPLGSPSEVLEALSGFKKLGFVGEDRNR